MSNAVIRQDESTFSMVYYGMMPCRQQLFHPYFTDNTICAISVQYGKVYCCSIKNAQWIVQVYFVVTWKCYVNRMTFR